MQESVRGYGEDAEVCLSISLSSLRITDDNTRFRGTKFQSYLEAMILTVNDNNGPKCLLVENLNSLD